MEPAIATITKPIVNINVCRCVISGLLPISMNTMYRTLNGRIILSESGRKFKSAMSKSIITHPDKQFISGIISVEINLQFKDKRKRDVDNYAKAILDCAKTHLFEDDSSIFKLTMTKRLGMPDNSIEIIVQSMEL